MAGQGTDPGQARILSSGHVHAGALRHPARFECQKEIRSTRKSGKAAQGCADSYHAKARCRCERASQRRAEMVRKLRLIDTGTTLQMWDILSLQCELTVKCNNATWNPKEPQNVNCVIAARGGAKVDVLWFWIIFLCLFIANMAVHAGWRHLPSTGKMALCAERAGAACRGSDSISALVGHACHLVARGRLSCEVI